MKSGRRSSPSSPSPLCSASLSRPLENWMSKSASPWSPRAVAAARIDQKNFTSRWRSARLTARSCSSSVESSSSGSGAASATGGPLPRALAAAQPALVDGPQCDELLGHAFEVELVDELAKLLAFLG